MSWEDLFIGALIAVGIALVFFFLVVFVVQASLPHPSDFGRAEQESGAPEYSVFYIEGMPCVWVEHTGDMAGLSCDWSRWSGE